MVKSSGHIPDAVDDLVDGAVAAAGNNGLKTVADGLRRQFAGLAGLAGVPPDGMGQKIFQTRAQGLGFLSSCRWIQDDAGLHSA